MLPAAVLMGNIPYKSGRSFILFSVNWVLIFSHSHAHTHTPPPPTHTLHKPTQTNGTRRTDRTDQEGPEPFEHDA